jgi:hypothetical protein
MIRTLSYNSINPSSCKARLSFFASFLPISGKIRQIYSMIDTRITRSLDSNDVDYRILPDAEPVFTVEAAAVQREVVLKEMIKSILLRLRSNHYPTSMAV